MRHRNEVSFFSGLLVALSLAAPLLAESHIGQVAGVTVGGVVAVIAFGGLIVSTLRLVQDGAPEFPRPRLSLGWLRDIVSFAGKAIAWAAPQIPFAAPFIVFVAVTWPLAQTSESLQFQQQASEIIPVLLIGYVIETGAIRWRNQPVNWVLSLMTVLILVTGETYALVDLATKNPDHADIIAGSMAAGVVAILVAAIQGAREPDEAEHPDIQTTPPARGTQLAQP